MFIKNDDITYIFLRTYTYKNYYFEIHFSDREDLLIVPVMSRTLRETE